MHALIFSNALYQTTPRVLKQDLAVMSVLFNQQGTEHMTYKFT